MLYKSISKINNNVDINYPLIINLENYLDSQNLFKYFIFNKFVFSWDEDLSKNESEYIIENNQYLVISFFYKVCCFSISDQSIKLLIEFQFSVVGILIYNEDLIIVTEGELYKFVLGEACYLLSHLNIINENGIVDKYSITENELILTRQDNSISKFDLNNFDRFI